MCIVLFVLTGCATSRDQSTSSPISNPCPPYTEVIKEVMIEGGILQQNQTGMWLFDGEVLWLAPDLTDYSEIQEGTEI